MPLRLCYNAHMTATLRLIDTHAHLALDQYADDRPAVLERAAAAGVARLIEIGYDLQSSRAAVGLAAQHPAVYAVVGIQPNHVHTAPADWSVHLRELAAQPKVVGIGEIGLDYHWMQAPPGVQEHFFRAQLALARSLTLPVVIHSREAQADTLRILSDAARGQPGVMHSFSGDWAYAEVCLDIGFDLSFSGPLTFRKAAELHEVARRAPLDRVLTETDSPYLTPHPYRGKRNEPAYVGYVLRQFAALRSMSEADAAAAVWANAERLFRFNA